VTRGRVNAAGARLVYSTDPTRAACPRCHAYPCECAADAAPVAPADQRLVVRLDRAGRKGKTVTRVEGFAGPDDARATVLRELKQACSCGGTAAGDALELQGDHRTRAADWLAARGYGVVRRA